MHPSSFVSDLWYVAAWSYELRAPAWPAMPDARPLARRLLGMPIVLYRGADGVVHALEDRCCHRGLPLSLGRVVGTHLQCGYHGLTYDGAGRCVRIPGQAEIPVTARVRSFPVAEEDGLVWLWPGDGGAADRSLIVRFPRHVDPAWSWRGERFDYRADHLLLYDNLLDLTHVGYVHPETIGGHPDEHSNATMTVSSDGASLKGVRWMRDVEPPPAYQALRPFAGRIDRWQTIRFDPGVVRISIAAKDAGTARDDEDFDGAYESHGFHGVTPEAPGRCHYFWSVGVPSQVDAPGLIERKVALTRRTFEEDRVILEAQFARVSEDPQRSLVGIRSDGLALKARRVWQRLLDREVHARGKSFPIVASTEDPR